MLNNKSITKKLGKVIKNYTIEILSTAFWLNLDWKLVASPFTLCIAGIQYHFYFKQIVYELLNIPY